MDSLHKQDKVSKPEPKILEPKPLYPRIKRFLELEKFPLKFIQGSNYNLIPLQIIIGQNSVESSISPISDDTSQHSNFSQLYRYENLRKKYYNKNITILLCEKN